MASFDMPSDAGEALSQQVQDELNAVISAAWGSGYALFFIALLLRRQHDHWATSHLRKMHPLKEYFGWEIIEKTRQSMMFFHWRGDSS